MIKVLFPSRIISLPTFNDIRSTFKYKLPSQNRKVAHLLGSIVPIDDDDDDDDYDDWIIIIIVIVTLVNLVVAIFI